MNESRRFFKNQSMNGINVRVAVNHALPQAYDIIPFGQS